MNHEGIIDREIYTSNDEFVIAPIINKDRENYVKLHKELNGEKTLYLNPVCKDIMWEQTLQGQDKVYSVFEKMGVVLIGEEESCYKSFMKYLNDVVKNQDLTTVES